MLITANIQPLPPQRFPKNCWVYLQIQVNGAFTLRIGREMGEVQNPNDGLVFTQASTQPPVRLRWSGDLWSASNVNNSQFVLIEEGREPITGS